MDRIDEGLKPACVSKCVTHCLEFGRMADIQRDRRDQISKAVAFELEKVVSAR